MTDIWPLFLCFLAGLIVGMVLTRMSKKDINGYLILDKSLEDRDRWTIRIDDDPSDAKYVILEVMRKQV